MVCKNRGTLRFLHDKTTFPKRITNASPNISKETQQLGIKNCLPVLKNTSGSQGFVSSEKVGKLRSCVAKVKRRLCSYIKRGAGFYRRLFIVKLARC